MGQTLSHGVYLPNEGERNCYAGLASNWQILNTAVGNIAEKAPLVHTHGNISNDGKVGTTANLPLITGTGGAVQAGSFGNQANTFCEGNDSRLSDARTPVAHTHTKSDITNLFNSANTWTGTNTFTANNLYHTAEAPSYILKSSTTQEGVVPSGNRIAYAGYWQDKNSNILGYDRFVFYSTGLQTYEINIRNKATNGSFDPNGSLIQSGYQLSLYPSGNSELKIYAHTLPNGNNTWNLGDSNHKWKTLNGVNPGALSLPNVRAAVADPISTVGWNLSGSRNKYTPTEDGWFYIRVAGTGSCAINIHNGDTDNSYPTWFNTSTGGYATLVVPCEKEISLYIYISATSIEYCSFRPCIGNV